MNYLRGKKSSNTYQNNIFLDWKHTFFNFLHPFSSEVVAPRVDSIIPHQAPSLTKSTYGRALSPSRVVYCNLYVPTKTSVKVKAHCIKQQTRTRASRYASFLSFCHCTPWFPQSMFTRMCANFLRLPASHQANAWLGRCQSFPHVYGPTWQPHKLNKSPASHPSPFLWLDD